VSRSKQKGTAAETAVVRHLETTWPHVERRALNGSADRGDIAGIIGICLEVKAHARYAIPEWLTELDAEIANDGAAHGVLVVKPKGVGATRVGEWWAITRLDDYTRLLTEAGY
jgi:hypothetical protein